MMGLAPLFLIWLASRRSAALPMAPMPTWPTPGSPPPMPPPPMPAFQPQPTTHAESGTPLQDLHTAHEIPPPATAIEPAQQKQKQKPKAKAKPKSKAAAAKAAADTQVATVASVQSILNARGAKLKKDGLYGPKTAAAWSAAARKKSLPATISRVGPTVARVSRQAYESLKTPAIP